MKYLLPLVLLVAGIAQAQTIEQTVRYDWVLPVRNVPVPPATEGTLIPATGPNALAKVEGWLSTSAIPDNPTTSPTFSVGGTVTTASPTITVPAGSTILMRGRACNNAGFCSVLTSPVPITAAGVPGQMTNVQVQFVVTQPSP